MLENAHLQNRLIKAGIRISSSKTDIAEILRLQLKKLNKKVNGN